MTLQKGILIPLSIVFLLPALARMMKIHGVEKIRPLYTLKARPEPGDWLSTHKETHQNFESYVNSDPSRPDSLRRFIYVYQLGNNSKREDSLVSITSLYLERFFHLKVKMGGVFPADCIPPAMKRDFGADFQVRTTFILDTLANLPLPADAAIGLCFTKYDLYPDDDWNFVFGQASRQDRVGVWSFNRYGNPEDLSDFFPVLKRTLKVASHETGHMFSLKHCIRYNCTMNGSNSLGESDAKPMYYCPDCLEKLGWNIGFELKAHLAGLRDFYKFYGFAEEEAFIEKNLRYLNN